VEPLAVPPDPLAPTDPLLPAVPLIDDDPEDGYAPELLVVGLLLEELEPASLG